MQHPKAAPFLLASALYLSATPISHALDLQVEIRGALAGSYVSVEDPEGSTETAGAWTPSVAATLSPEPGSRFWVGLSYHDFALDPSESNISQRVQAAGLDLSYQQRFNFGTNLQPWLGGGIGAVYGNYTNRHRVDQFGNIIPGESYPDRTGGSMELTVNAVLPLPIMRSLDLSVFSSYHEPMGDGIRNLRLGLTLLI